MITAHTSLELGMDIPVRIWQPDGSDNGESLPLILATDGTEHVERGQILPCIAAAISDGRIGKHRVALIDPARGLRNDWYSSDHHADALSGPVLDAVGDNFNVRPGIVGVGYSLGAMAILRTAYNNPGLFTGMFLQSPSAFTAEHIENYSEERTSEENLSMFKNLTELTYHINAEDWPGDFRMSISITYGERELTVYLARALATRLELQNHEVYGLLQPGFRHEWGSWRSGIDNNLIDHIANCERRRD